MNLQTFPIYLTHDVFDGGDHLRTSRQIEVYLDPELKVRVGTLLKMDNEPLHWDFETYYKPLLPGDPRLANMPQVIAWMTSVLNSTSNEFDALLASMTDYDLANDGTPFHLDIFEMI